MNLEPGVQIDLLGAMKRRAALIASVAGGVFLASYWLAMILPNEYSSYATLLVEPPSINQSLVETGVAERDINTRLNLMTARILSRPRLSRMIDEFRLYEDESEHMTRAGVIALMRAAITVVPVAGALIADKDGTGEVNTFQIHFSYKSFAVPAKIAQTLAQDFIDEHIEESVDVTQKSLEFIESEQVRLAVTIAVVEAKIAAVKNANPNSLPENLQSNQQRMLLTISNLRAAQQQLATAESDESFWNTQNISLAPEGNANDAASPGRRLQLLELALSGFASKGFTEKHPDVVAAKQEIEAIRASVKRDEASDRPMNFAQLSVRAEQRRAELRVQASRNEISRLSESVAETQSAMAGIPRVAEQLDSLERQWKQLSRNLGDFETRRLRASVQANLERRQLGEQFKILEPAFAPLGPSSPNRILILALGAILGLVMGVGVGIGLETIDGSVHGPRDLQTALSIPVLATVPAILLESDRLLRLRRRLRYSLAATAVVIVSLAGGAVSYIIVNGAPGFLQNLRGAGDEEEVPTEAPAATPGAETTWRVPLGPSLAHQAEPLMDGQG